MAIYAPDGSNATYWTELHDKTDQKKFKQILIGDFNVTFDPYLDRTNYKTYNHTKAEQWSTLGYRERNTLMLIGIYIHLLGASHGDGMAIGVTQADI